VKIEKKLDKLNSIFKKKINNKSKLIPFNTMVNDVGPTKYFPASSKEWKDSIYFFNHNNIKNLPSNHININKLLTSYFHFSLKKAFVLSKYISLKRKKKAFNKILISKAEIKHTNSKSIITVFIYNKEKLILIKKIKKIKKLIFIIINMVISYIFRLKYLQVSWNKIINKKQKNKRKIRKILVLKFVKRFGLYKYFVKRLKKLLYEHLMIIRRYKLRLNVNKYKFEEVFIYKLSTIISRYFNHGLNLTRRIEFNIINLKSIAHNTDIFTQLLKKRLIPRNAKILRNMKFMLNKAKIPILNRIKEKSRVIKSLDMNLLENKYKNLNINSIIGLDTNNLDLILKGLYSSSILFKKKRKYMNSKLIVKNNYEIYNTIFNSIKYKHMAGMRIEVKGRLTKRRRADRSLYKVLWKGGLRNIDSAYKGLSSVNFRGYRASNVEYSIITSKRSVGAFGVKGWISGKL